MQAPRDAPLAAEGGQPAGELDRCLVVEGDAPAGIGGVDGGRQRLEQAAVPLLALAQRLLAPLELGDVLEAINAADDLAGAVEQRVNIGEDGGAAAVGPLDDDFAVPHRQTGAQHLGHRRFGRRQRRATGAIGLVAAAIALPALAERASPQLGGAAIVLHDDAVAVARVNANGQPVEKAVPRLERLLQRERDHRQRCGLTPIGGIAHEPISSEQEPNYRHSRHSAIPLIG